MARKKGERLKVTRMAKRFDGSGVVGVQCSEGVFTRLKLSEMPRPRDWGTVVNGRVMVYLDTRAKGVDSERYRVMWPELSNGPRSKPATSSFILTGSHTNETLYVFTEFLRDQGVDFVRLTNKHGNGFSDVRLSGSDLAYLSRDIPHSPACHVDFAETDTPEVSWPSRWIVPASSLDGQTNRLRVTDVHL